MITDKLEEALRTGPKFIYVLPNFQNPTGTTLALERRYKLIELADRLDIDFQKEMETFLTQKEELLGIKK